MEYNQLELDLLESFVNEIVISIKKENIKEIDKYIKYATTYIERYKKFQFESLDIKNLAILNRVKKDMNNLTKTVGFKNITGFENIRQFYLKETSLAILDYANGKELDKITEHLIAKLANSGIRSIDYLSGKTMRLEYAVDRAVWGGKRMYLDELALERAKEIDTDVFEMTWHPAHRPTHDWGGKRYSLSGSRGYPKPSELFTNGSPQDYGCLHRANPVPHYLPPIHSDKELKKLQEREKTEIEFRGKKYTPYDARVRIKTAQRIIDKNNLKKNLMESNNLNTDLLNLKIQKQENYLKAMKNKFKVYPKEGIVYDK